MTLDADEFMRRFLLHVLPSGFHRIRHYGLMANADRRNNLARTRELLLPPPSANPPTSATTEQQAVASAGPMRATFICPDCGAPMIIVDIIGRGHLPRAPPLRLCTT